MGKGQRVGAINATVGGGLPREHTNVSRRGSKVRLFPAHTLRVPLPRLRSLRASLNIPLYQILQTVTKLQEILLGKDPRSTSIHKPAEVAVLKINGPEEFGSLKGGPPASKGTLEPCPTFRGDDLKRVACEVYSVLLLRDGPRAGCKIGLIQHSQDLCSTRCFQKLFPRSVIFG